MKIKMKAILPKIIFAASVIMLFISIISKIFFGGYFMNNRLLFVMSESMEPTIQTGSVILAQRFTEEDFIEIGDIITFPVNGYDITHRVVDITSDGTLITKGDNNESTDNFGAITRSDVSDVIITNRNGTVNNILPIFLLPCLVIYFMNKFLVETEEAIPEIGDKL